MRVNRKFDSACVRGIDADRASNADGFRLSRIEDIIRVTMKRALETLVAGLVVYVAMAACSGAQQANDGDEATAASDPSGGTKSDSSTTGEGGNLLNPVPDAQASSGGASDGAPSDSCSCPEPVEPEPPKEPLVVTLECPSASGVVTYDVPGATAAELSAVRYIFPKNAAGAFEGYALTGPVQVKDGSVLATCYGPHVTLVIPGELL